LFICLVVCLFVCSILSVLFYHYHAFGEIKIYIRLHTTRHQTFKKLTDS